MNISSVGPMPSPMFGLGIGAARPPIGPNTVLEDIGVDISDLEALAGTVGETGESLEAAVGESATMRDVMAYVIADRGGSLGEALGGFRADMGFPGPAAGLSQGGMVGAGIDVEAVKSKYLEFLFAESEDEERWSQVLDQL